MHIQLLKLIFGFDKWHVYGSHVPEYVETVSSLANSLENKKVCIEVGCGLGNILRRVEYVEKFGMDTDPGVIKALKFLKKSGVVRISGNIEVKEGSFEEIPKNLEIDLLIAINWVHNLKFDELVKKFNSVDSKYIITEGVEGYSNFHSKELFIKHFNVLKEEIVGPRHIFLLSSSN
jgi:hypothetical protein